MALCVSALLPDIATRVSLQFDTPSPEAAERFLEEYVLAELDRVRATEACDAITFVPGQPATGDRTAGVQVPPPEYPVYLTIRGDTDAVIDAERNRWDALVDEGVLGGWERLHERDREEMVAELGAERAELLARSSDLAARMATVALREFEDLGTVPAAVETYPETESDAAPFGWWAVLHTVTVQLNYSLAEERDAYRYGLEHVLRNVAEHEDEETASRWLENLIADLEGLRETVTDGRLDS